MIVVSREMGFDREAEGEIIFYDEGKFFEKFPPDKFFNYPKEEKTKKFLD